MAVHAIDVGGTRIKLAVVHNGTVIAGTVLDAHSERGLGRQLPKIAAALKEITPESISVTGLGMAFPSLIDPETDRVLGDVGKYADAPSLDLARWSREEFGLEFAIENDARMACIGEWRYGAGRGYSDIVMMTLGTGIGTGVIMGGTPLRGKHGQAGILGGHFIIRPDGRQCACGAHGCAETEASTAWLSRNAQDDPDFAMSRLRNRQPLDYEAVFEEAIGGDACAIRLKDQSIRVWGAVGVSLIHAYDPEIVIIGGGILAGGEAVLAPIRSIIERDAWTPRGKPKVAASELGNDAALVAGEWLLESRRQRVYDSASF